MYNTRYWFLKRIYPNHLLLLKTNKCRLGYKCFGVDKYILDNIINYTSDINVIESKLIELNINYMKVEELQITEIYNFEENKYNDYMYKYLVLNILDRIRSCVLRCKSQYKNLEKVENKNVGLM